MKASPISSLLALHPEAGMACADDTEVLRFITELGVNAAFEKSSNEGWTQHLMVGNHATHWILFACHTGYPKPEDNGYNMVSLPKQHVSFEAATTRFHDIIRYMSRSGTVSPPRVVNIEQKIRNN